MDFEYITQLVPGSGCRLDEFETTLKGCECVGGSCAASSGGCSCLLYKKDIFQNNTSLIASSLDLPILECSDECACALNDKPCNNRCLQLGVTLPLEVFVTARKGMGLRCRDRIAKGRFVIEYIGEVIGAEEVLKRISPINYVLTVNEFFIESDTTSSECCSSSSVSAVEEEKRKRWRANATFIDPTRRGNLARFINHSCDPNLRLIPVRIGTPLVHIGLFACRTIEPLEELTYDYGKGESNVNLIQLPCHCDSKNCRRFLPASASAIS